MADHVVGSSGYEFPTLQLRPYPWWERIYRAIRFLPHAFRAIRERRLMPEYSFHLLNAQACLIGISHGDIRYPATVGELGKLEPLIVQLEDKRFFRHIGIDLLGILRAVAINIKFRQIVQGGSTITQQLVRNTLLVPERLLLRKLLEVILALKLEKHFSKQEILDLYCNHVYLGSGVRGFSAAAKIVFRQRLSGLNDYQICALLGLLRTPERTFPEKSAENFTSRREKISKILKFPVNGTVKSLANPNPIRLARHRSPRLTRIVKTELIRLLGEIPADMRRVGLTINAVVQSSLDEALSEISRRSVVASVAGIVLSTATADVLAEGSWEAGRDAQFSPAYFGSLQPGSTYKTFALLAALQQGVSLAQLVQSAPFESISFQGLRNRPWRVRNYANIYRGTISLAEAFKWSDNTAFARLTEILDVEQMFSLYKSFGLYEGEKASPAIVLGGNKGGINLLTLVSAYRAIARGGTYTSPRIIQYLEFDDGSHQFFRRSEEFQIIREYKAVLDIQKALLQAGPLIKGVSLAGKTGTTRTGSLLVSYDDQM